MLLRKLAILFSSLLFMRCNDSSPAEYYSYLQVVKGQPKLTPVDNSKLQVHFQMEDNFKIIDTSKKENIKVQISFNGLIEVYPEDFHFELYANDQKISIPDTINYTITTVIDDKLKYLKTVESTFRVKEIVNTVKKNNNIPDSITYYSVSGIIKNIPLNNTHNPSQLKLHLKAYNNENLFYDKEQVYELKRPILYKTRSRPFG